MQGLAVWMSFKIIWRRCNQILNSVDRFLDDAGNAFSDLEDLYSDKRRLESSISRAEERAQDNVVMALYDLQDSLESDEEVTLVESTESGRGGFYSFEEVLTSEGVVAEVEGEYSSSALYTWPGNFDDRCEPLDIETEYLVADRDKPGFVRKLFTRLENLDGEPPESSFYYD